MLTILNADDLRKHFKLWLAMVAAAEPMDPHDLPKDMRQLIDRLNIKHCGDKEDAGCGYAWACRYTGHIEGGTAQPKVESARTFYIAGPGCVSLNGIVLIGGEIDPSEVQEWESGLGLDFQTVTKLRNGKVPTNRKGGKASPRRRAAAAGR